MSYVVITDTLPQEPCGAVDRLTGAVCNCTLVHNVHKDESADFVITWVDTGVLITP